MDEYPQDATPQDAPTEWVTDLRLCQRPEDAVRIPVGRPHAMSPTFPIHGNDATGPQDAQEWAVGEPMDLSRPYARPEA